VRVQVIHRSLPARSGLDDLLSIEVTPRPPSRAATLIEPLLIVVMGLVVMLIVLAVLLPSIRLTQWLR